MNLLIIAAWIIAAAVTLLGWCIVYDEIAAPQSWARRAAIVIGWACVTWAVSSAAPY